MIEENKMFYQSNDGIKLCGIITKPLNSQGCVLLTHGITTDKNEWKNFYIDISHELSKRDFTTLRFDFRAHGESEGLQRDMTIIGELLDIKASSKNLYEQNFNGISIVATSFSAGPAILYAALNKEKIKCLVLLCPVIDYIATFLKPITPWAKETFNEEGFEHLEMNGSILLDGNFELGAKLIEEFKLIRPFEYLNELDCPVLTIHGDKDTMVPYEISKKYGAPNIKSQFITIEEADHGFIDYRDEVGKSKESYKNKKFVIEKISDWIQKWG